MKRFCKIFSAVLALLMISGCAGKGGSDELTASASAMSEYSEAAEFRTETARASETVIINDDWRETTVSASKNPPTSAEKSTAVTTVKATVKTTEKETEKATKAQTAATTEKSEKGDGVIIGLNLVLFGCGRDEIISFMGNPTESVSERLKNGSKLESLVYAADYGRLAVFQLLDGSFAAFYTCARDTIVTDGSDSLSLKSGAKQNSAKQEYRFMPTAKRAARSTRSGRNMTAFHMNRASLTGSAVRKG